MASEQPDLINKPPHYRGFSNGAEVIDITERLNFNRGNAVKYLARAGRKQGQSAMDDLQKAAWYVQREIDRLILAAYDPSMLADLMNEDQ